MKGRTSPRRARSVRSAAAVAVTILTVGLAGCGGSSTDSASESDAQQQADMYAISQIQSTFHKALSKKDIDLMMSVWSPDATFTAGRGATFSGADAIRNHWLTSTPFQPENNWVAETPGYKTRVTASGDKGTLFFECHLVDADTSKAVIISGADAQVTKIDGKWLITSFVGSTATLQP